MPAHWRLGFTRSNASAIGQAIARTRRGSATRWRRQPPLGMPFTLLALWSTPEEQFDCARRVAAKFTVPASALLPRPRPRPRDRIRLGYLSADFRQHAVAFLDRRADRAP